MGGAYIVILSRVLSTLRGRRYCRLQSARRVTREERDGIITKVKSLGPWFHNYQIAANVWTNPTGNGPGSNYPDWRWNFVSRLLPDVSGKTCLDIGCSSGFFSLKMKELGAAYVLGLDAGEQPLAIEQAKFAAETLRMDVDFRTVSVYDLAKLGQQFDTVLFLGVLYHLRHPLLALDAARSVCRGTLILQTITTEHAKAIDELEPSTGRNVGFRSTVLSDERFPALRFIESALDGDTTCWFVPNVQAVNAMLRSSGFVPEEWVFPTEREVIVRCNVG